MSLISSNTKWVLFLSSSDLNPEERHILDLAFGLLCLERAGVAPEDIHIYVDGTDRAAIASLFQVASSHAYQIKVSNDFFEDMSGDNTYENLVMFVTGHGSEKGIDAPSPITPHSLLESLKSSSGLDKAIIYLGQCYAGIFNYVKAGRGQVSDDSDAEHVPDIILIGATELQESLSSATSERFVEDDVSWLANLFLLHVFKWISSPFDVDGDSKHTVMDSFKYSGVMTNRSHKQIKATSFIQLLDIYNELKLARENVQNPTGNVAVDQSRALKLQAIGDKYMQSSYLNNVHQECWVLNSIPAQHIEI